jgi:cellobiose-specific phosphotransferase system component IIC
LGLSSSGGESLDFGSAELYSEMNSRIRTVKALKVLNESFMIMIKLIWVVAMFVIVSAEMCMEKKYGKDVFGVENNKSRRVDRESSMGI